jgi:hypothetical protein
VTGTRDDNYFEDGDVQFALKEIKPDLVINGACPTGVDRMMLDQAGFMGVPTITMPAMWNEFGKRAGFIRNGDMARMFKDLQHYGHELICLAFPKGSDWSGTRHCMSEAEKYGWKIMNCGDQP